MRARVRGSSVQRCRRCMGVSFATSRGALASGVRRSRTGALAAMDGRARAYTDVFTASRGSPYTRRLRAGRQRRHFACWARRHCSCRNRSAHVAAASACGARDIVGTPPAAVMLTMHLEMRPRACDERREGLAAVGVRRSVVVSARLRESVPRHGKQSNRPNHHRPQGARPRSSEVSLTTTRSASV